MSQRPETTTRPDTNVLMIVSRHNSTLYTYACSEFEGLGKEIDVVLDRRRGERRRQPSAGNGTERRQADRRAYAIDEDLRGIGWALVRRDAPGTRPLTNPSRNTIA